MGATIFDTLRQEREQKPQQTTIFDNLRGERERSAEVKSMSPERTVGGTLGDIAVTAGKGIVGAGEAAVGLANLATPGIGQHVEDGAPENKVLDRPHTDEGRRHMYVGDCSRESEIRRIDEAEDLAR